MNKLLKPFKKGTKVYYSRRSYGIHIIKDYNLSNNEYLLDLDGDRFWAHADKVFIIKEMSR